MTDSSDQAAMIADETQILSSSTTYSSIEDGTYENLVQPITKSVNLSSIYTSDTIELEVDTTQVLLPSSFPNAQLDQIQENNKLEDGDCGQTVSTSTSEQSSESLASALEIDEQHMHQIPQHKPVVCGHRGAVYKSLENTRHSIQVAHEIGCEEIEIDVFLLKCGTLCVFHGYGTDQNPGRFENYCSNMEGSILDYTYDELRMNYKFNPNYDEFGCGPDIIQAMEKEGACYIPTLEQVLLDAKKYGVVIKIELKGPGTARPTLELVEKLDMVDQIHFGSFDLTQIQTIRDLRPQRCSKTGQYIYKTGALFDHIPKNFIQIAMDVGASEVHLCYNACTKSRVDAIHGAGMDSMCWFRGPIGMKSDVTTRFDDVGNEDEKMFRTVMATGVRKMCVNKPDVLLRTIQQ